MHLVEISVVDQRYQAVMAVVQDGWKVTEVAEHFGVARQTVHRWIARHNAGGVLALTDGSHRRRYRQRHLGRHLSEGGGPADPAKA